MEVNNKKITAYYKEMGLDVDFGISITKLFRIICGKKKGSVIVTESRFLQRALIRLNIYTVIGSQIERIAEQYFAILDALILLAKKKVPVYYYNRIGKEKNGFCYSNSAVNRMRKHLSFPVMVNDVKKYKSDFKELFGELYNVGYIKEIAKIPQVIQKGDLYRHEDCSSKYVNIIDGRRIVNYQPKEYTRTIHVYGRCGAFGYAVEDKNTLPSQMQLQFDENDYNDIRVVNHGLWGGEDEYLDHNFLHDVAGFKEGDIVLFYRMHIDKRLLKHWEDRGVKYKEITHEWHQYPEAKWCFYDKPGHMNHIGYGNVAKIICKDMIADKFSCKNVNEIYYKDFKSDNLTAYLKNNSSSDFNKEINVYIDTILKEYPLKDSIKECGAIVMNCNPFTKGHRYLIEYAAKQVDRLYIFVVQEDKSFFKYEDRFEMVKKGTVDLENVVVISSGKFIISSLTFPEYFMKDYVKEKNFDVSMDLETFCRYIAPPLKIKKRFAGEEPFDPVTKNYNENMGRILPEYGMEFCEIPRMSLDNERVINATEVRRLLKERNFCVIGEYVPQSTLEILKARY